ncbi:TPA: hypothetical protein DCX16_03715, partial [bacterium]|nr:hypothetical protein [bacterium]
MKKIIIGVFLASNLWAGIETVTTYHDPDFKYPEYEFEDESMVYVAVVGARIGGFVYGTATASNGSIRVYFEDDDNDGTFTGFFKISKTSTNKECEILRLLPDEIGTITIDLDDDGNVGSATIKAIGREMIMTFDQDRLLTTDFPDDSTVHIIATVGYIIGTPSIKGTVTGPLGNIRLRFTDFDNDGTYTTSFKIDKDGTNTEFPPILKLLPEENAVIEVDLNYDKRIGSATIRAIDYGTPSVTIQTSYPKFSPYASFGVKDTITITIRSSRYGPYKILIDDKIIREEMAFPDRDEDFVWNGGYREEFSEGSHTLLVEAFDMIGNKGTASTIIFIDNTSPSIIKFSVFPLVFSPGTSIGVKDHCRICFSSNETGTYEIKVDGKTPTGIYLGDLSYVSTDTYSSCYTWDGFYATEPAPDGLRYIQIYVIDEAGNSNFEIVEVTIDRTPPEIIFLAENTNGDTFYRDEVVQFTLKARDWIGSQEIGINDPYESMIVLTQGTKTREISFIYLGEGKKGEGSLYQGYHTVREEDTGTWIFSGYIIDNAGNRAINYGTGGTIILDGSRTRPFVKTMITRVGFIPEKEKRPPLSGLTIVGSTTESMSIMWQDEDLDDGQKVKVVDLERKHIWVGTSTDKTITLNNSLLYYGSPISDYTGVNPDTSHALKDTLKAGDNIIFSLEAVRIDSVLLFGTPEKCQGSLTVFNPNINIGDLILVSDNKNTWIKKATSPGSFVISNQNLYSGPLVSDYNKISPSIGGKVSPARGGDAKIDIGSIVSISLSDDGIDGIGILSGDIIMGDGIYSGVYTIKKGNDTKDAQVIGRFIYNRRSAENSPYQDERQKITIDATAPVISNNSVSPIPFNPYLTNLSIKYNLSEKAWVKIKIYNPNGEPIRILESPEAQFGENVTLNWDGKNSGGIVVEDGHYTYIIEAEDLAGNKAIEAKGEIVLTLVEIVVENLNVSPNPFWPNKEVPETVDVVVSFRVVLKNSKEKEEKVTDKQLNNLGFYFGFCRDYTKESGYKYCNYLNAPYALLNLKVYDQNGKELILGFYPDLSAKDDIDWELRGPPIYADGSHGYSCDNWYTKNNWYLGNPDEPDKGDGNITNDYGNLVPFHKNIRGDYYYDFKYGIVDWNLAEGTYIFRIGAELLSIGWELVNDSGDKDEKWHAYPRYRHYGLKSEIVDKEVFVEPPPPPVLPDTQAPVVESIDPSAGQTIDTGSITYVSATLKEKPDLGGSGIDFARSEIFLVDKTGQKIGGRQENDGESKIFWSLDVPLDTKSPGSYTIRVRPVDVKGNGMTDDYQNFVFIIKDIIKPNIYDPSPSDGKIEISPFSGPIWVYVSDIERGESGINWQNSFIYLKKDKGRIPITVTTSHLVTPNTNNNAGKLRGDLDQALPDDGNWDGTYTITVVVRDGAGNEAEESFKFYLKTIFPIVSDPYPPDGSTFVSPYKGTISAQISEEEKGAGIDWDKSTIILTVPDGREIGLTKKYEPISDFAGRIIGVLESPLYEAGEYHWTVKAYDYADHYWSCFYTFKIRVVQPNISNPYPRKDVKAPYVGTISVDVWVAEGDPELDTATIKLQLKKDGKDIQLDGVYYIGGTQSGKIIGTPTGPLLEGEYTIWAEARNIKGSLRKETFRFRVSWKKPDVFLSVTPDVFSPYTSHGIADFATITFHSDESGTYSITVDGRELKDATGYLPAGSITQYTWYGKDKEGLEFSEGQHLLSISVTNDGGKTGVST